MAQRYYSSTAVQMALVGSVDDTSVAFVVDSVNGLPTSTPFTVVVDVGTASEEIVTVTAVAGTTLTVTRAQDGSTAVAHLAGAEVRHMATARDYREPQQHINATSNVHGVTSPVVGRDDVQTLTNKLISGADNTLSAIPAAAVPSLVTLSDDFDAHVADTSAHGVTGDVVGTTDTQVLSNKTLVSPVVTSPPVNVLNPVGSVVMWTTEVAPTGYLICDGTPVSRVTYADLYAVIGTTYGAGNGVNTFNLPNLKGRVPVGKDAAQTEFDTMGETSGAKTVTLTEAQIPSHTHTQQAHTHVSPAHAHDQYVASTVAAGTGVRHDYNGDGISAPFPQGITTGATAVTINAATAVNNATGGGGAHNNLQPYLVLNFIIKH